MPTIGKIKAELLGDTRHFDRSFQRAGRRVRGFREQLGSLRRTIVPLTGAVGFGALIRSTFREADEMGNLARRLGTSVESFSKLTRVLQRSGIGLAQSATILQRLQRRAADAQDGNVKLADTFRQLGINVDALIARDPVEAFLQVADALGRVQPAAERIQLAFRLLDTEGVQVLQTDLRNLRAEMARTTGISDAQAASIKRLADNWTRLGETLRSLTATGAEASGVTNFLGNLAGIGEVAMRTSFTQRYASLRRAQDPNRRLGLTTRLLDWLTGYRAAPAEAPRTGRIEGLGLVGLPRPAPPRTLRGGGGVFEGGLGASNAMLEQLRAIRRNTEVRGAVLE